MQEAIQLDLIDAVKAAPDQKLDYEGWKQAIRDALKRGVVVIAATQCLRGSVSLGTYEVGRYLLELGVVSAGDMTTEACVTKVAYLCGRGLQGDALRAQIERWVKGGQIELDTGAALIAAVDNPALWPMIAETLVSQIFQRMAHQT